MATLTHAERADFQTNEVCAWLDNDEGMYFGYVSHLEKYGMLCGSSAKMITHRLIGDRLPDGSGMSRTRWADVAAHCNQEIRIDAWRLWRIKAAHRAANGLFFDRDVSRYIAIHKNTRAIANPDDKSQPIGSMFVIAYHHRHYQVMYFCHVLRTIAPIAGMRRDTLDRALSAMRDLSFHSIESTGGL